METELNKALFLDMDLTIVETNTGNDHPINMFDWKFIDDNLNKVGEFIRRGYIPIIVSNQGGIELGYTTKDQIEAKIRSVIRIAELRLGAKEGTFHYYYSETDDNKDPMRKPNTGMALKAQKDFFIDLQQSVMVGDKDTDKEFAKNAGIGKFYWADEFKNAKI